MRINIENIGLIRRATIDCDFITLITGKNGSGKTTFAKSVCSLFQGLDNFYANFLKNTMDICSNKLRKSFDEIFHNPYVSVERVSYFLSNYPNLRFFKKIYENKGYPLSIEQCYRFINEAIYELKNENNTIFYLLKEVSSFGLNSRYSNLNFEDTSRSLILQIIDILFETLQRLDGSMKIPQSFCDLYIKKQLDYNFNGQVKPIFNPKSETKISVQDLNFSYLFNYDLNNDNSITNSPEYVDKDTIPNVFYINDSNVIDKISLRKSPKRYKDDNSFTVIEDLENKLLESLRQPEHNDIDDLIKYKEIIDLFDSIIPYSFFKKQGIFISNKDSLRIENEASGKKIFIILKMLFKNRVLNNNTLIIFDEPENHLHPEWQVVFAELLIKLNKYFGSKFICITHNPNLLHAFDVKINFERKNDLFKVYYCESNEGQFSLTDCSKDLSIANRKLLEPYISLSVLGE